MTENSMTNQNPFAWQEKIDSVSLPPRRLALMVHAVQRSGGISVTCQQPAAKDMALALEAAGHQVLMQVVDALPERIRIALHEHDVSFMMKVLDDRDEALERARGNKARFDDVRAELNRLCSILDPTSTTKESAEQIASRVAAELSQLKQERDAAAKQSEQLLKEREDWIIRIGGALGMKIGDGNLLEAALRVVREREEAYNLLASANKKSSVLKSEIDTINQSLSECQLRAATAEAARNTAEFVLREISHALGGDSSMQLVDLARFVVSERDAAKRLLREQEEASNKREFVDIGELGALREERDRLVTWLEASDSERAAALEALKELREQKIHWINRADEAERGLCKALGALNEVREATGCQSVLLSTVDAVRMIVKARDEADHAVTVVARVRDLIEIAPGDPDTIGAVKRVVEALKPLRELHARALNTIEQARGILRAHESESLTTAAAYVIQSLKEEREKLAGAEQDLQSARRRIAELEMLRKDESKLWSTVREELSAADDDSVIGAARRVVKERDEAKRFMEVAHRQVDLDLSLITDVCEILGAKNADALREVAVQVVKDRDEAIGREKELGIFFRTADRVISEVRSALGIPNGPHVVEEVARMVKERDELYERSQAMITEVLERLGAAPMEPLHDLLNRVVQRSNESERIIASLSSSRKEFKDKLRECSQLLEEMREERDKAILKGLEEKNQTLGWLAAIPGVTVCAAESVHDRIQRVKLEIDRLNRQLDLAKDRADKAEESRDEAMDQLHEELRLAKEDRDLAVQKLQLMNAATLKNLKEFP